MYDLVVIGGGAGGLRVASAAANIGARVAVIEKNRLEGRSAASPSVPSKALIQAARVAHSARDGQRFGIHAREVHVDFRAVMARVRATIGEFAAPESEDRLQSAGIDLIRGECAFEAYDTVVLGNGQRVFAQRFVVATGSRPSIPEIPGLTPDMPLDFASIWQLDEPPESLLIIGGGANGVELAQAFQRLGTPVTILDPNDRLLPDEDPDASLLLEQSLRKVGVSIYTRSRISSISLKDGKKLVSFRAGPRADSFEALRSHILVAAGRIANVESLNLEAIGVRADPSNGIEVDETLQTSCRNVFALGDVLGREHYTHAAERQADVVFQNAMLRKTKRFDGHSIPRVLFTDPEIASVGTSESEAKSLDPDAAVLRLNFDQLDRARIDGDTRGFAKVIVAPSGRILGATITGTNAALVLQQFVAAMDQGTTLASLADTVQPYPTHAGLVRELASRFNTTRADKSVVRTALQWFYGFTSGERQRDQQPEDSSIHSRDAGH